MSGLVMGPASSQASTSSAVTSASTAVVVGNPKTAANPTSRSSARKPGKGRDVLLVGESVLRRDRVRMASAARAKGWRPILKTKASINTRWGLAQMKNLRKRGKLPKRIVITTGANDVKLSSYQSRRNINDTIRYLKRINRKVWWVNLRVRSTANKTAKKRHSNAPGFNRHLGRSLKSAGKNFKLIDYYRLTAKYRVSAIVSKDGIHLTSRGLRLKRTAILNALR